MADSLYRRLSCVDCSGAFAQLVTAGAPRKGCYDCRPKVCSAPVVRNPKMKDCAVCGSSFAAIGKARTCSKTCSDSLRKVHDSKRVVCSHAKPIFSTGRARLACYECEPAKKVRVRSPYKQSGRTGVCQGDGCAATFVKSAPHQKYCNDSCCIKAAAAMAAAAVPRACPICSKDFKSSRYKLTDYCSALCRSKALRGLFSCLQCGRECVKRGKSIKAGSDDKFCSRACSFTHKAATKATRVAKAAPKLSTYIAKPCDSCGKHWGARREWSTCDACKMASRRQAASIAGRALAEAKHKAAGKVVACDECGAQFCPVYGSQGRNNLCSPCAVIRSERYERDYKRRFGGNHVRRARKRGAERKTFDILGVLARDNWTCQLCGEPTPKELRGTCDPRAPELDHILPIAAGGAHVPENCQCACRECNGAKGANPLWRPTKRADAMETI